MKDMRKVMIMLLCIVSLVAVSIFGTLAYFTDSEAVTNTFTVGQVYIDLDEAPVGENGVEISGDRVKENTYKLIPGWTYDKDPTVHIGENSESCWVYVRVENGIADIEDQSNSIAAQIENNGWFVLDADEEPGVYYKQWTKGNDQNLTVFETFTINGSVTKDQLADAASGSYAKQIMITAYAIQLAGFEGDASGAWAALQEQIAANS